MPLVRSKVQEFIGKPGSNKVHPDEAVAIGAAIMAHSLSSKAGPQDMTLLDVLPMAIGINKLDGTMHVLFQKNQPLPDYKTRVLTTSKDNQRSIMLRIYQGESKYVADNELLGTFVFSGLREAPAKQVKIEVTFHIDSEGILNLTARDIDTGQLVESRLKLGRDEDAEQKKKAAASSGSGRKKVKKKRRDASLEGAPPRATGPDAVATPEGGGPDVPKQPPLAAQPSIAKPQPGIGRAAPRTDLQNTPDPMPLRSTPRRQEAAAAHQRLSAQTASGSRPRRRAPGRGSCTGWARSSGSPTTEAHTSSLAERVVVVLVEPLHPGNVGAAARAMHNFGLRRLVLVAPPAYDPERARWMAPGSADLLGEARIVADLDAALEGVHHAVGTTARHRRLGQPVLEPAEAARAALDRDGVTALLFGREDTGLPNEALARCEALLRIPTEEHASLNLAQAVLVCAHVLFEESRRRGGAAPGRTLGGTREKTTDRAERRDAKDRAADLAELEPLSAEVVGLLDRVGYLRGTAPAKVRVTTRTALQRASLSLRHVEALRGMVSRIGWALDHPGEDWTGKSGRGR
jgi:TrmH family RNA methyltransferase